VRMLSTMPLRAKASKPDRPPRIRVPNRERVLFTIMGHRFIGVLQRLSLTGGSVIHTEKPLPKGTLATLDLKTVFGRVTAQIEFLHVGADGNDSAQAFRFLGMDDSCTRRLKTAIERMEDAGYSDVDPSRNGLQAHVSEMLSAARRQILHLLRASGLREKRRIRG
jgi:hypothetical protein